MKAASKRRWLHLVLLLIWTGVGLCIRFANLTEKPLWTDELSTIVFGLGNSFLPVPLDQPITSEQLLAPLQPVPPNGVKAVVDHLLDESNHPPLYFILFHFWVKLFPTSHGLVSALAARSLPALLGTIAIPATFILGQIAFRSASVGQMAAAFMAVSPFGIYLAQEARHYTLSVLWVIVSLYCLVRACCAIRDRTPLPLPICITWVLANALGLSTHYFFCLTLGAEALVVGSLGLVQSWQERGIWYPAVHWKRIWGVTAGTIAVVLAWLPFLPDFSDNELTHWIYRSGRSGFDWLDPVVQAVAGWITMLYLLPIQAKSQPIVTVSAVLLILLVLWTLPKLWRGLKVQILDRGYRRLAVYVLSSFVGAAVLLIFGLAYVFGTDLTSAFRYNFVYFPAVTVLIGAALASGWNAAIRIAQTPADEIPPSLLKLISISGRKTVILIWLLSLLGGLTVVTNLGYQKTHRPDVVAKAIQQQSQGTALVAIAHQHHGQTGRLMSIALELQRSKAAEANMIDATASTPLFLLAHQTQNPQSVMLSLQQSLTQLPHPMDLWLINFQEVSEQALNRLLERQSCSADGKAQSIDGYRYRLYHCNETPPSNTSSPESRRT